MIKYYSPNALLRAHADIARKHPLTGGDNNLSEGKLRALLQRIIQARDEYLPILVNTLTKNERYAICDYLPRNKFGFPIQKIVSVVEMTMTINIYERLFKGWQNFPRNKELVLLLAKWADEPKYAQAIKIRAGLFRQWAEAFDDEYLYYRTIQQSLVSERILKDRSFMDVFAERGLMTSSVLYINCYRSLLSSCGSKRLLLEGDVRIFSAINAAQKTEFSERVMLNLLKQFAYNCKLINNFTNCFTPVNRRFGVPDRSQFPVDAYDAYYVYRWWYNFKLVKDSFNADADKRRVDFWTYYLDKCDMERFKGNEFVVFDFGTYCVVESEVQGTMYIYETKYYHTDVQRRLLYDRKQECKSWMKNFSRPVYRKTHAGAWENYFSYELRHLNII